MNPIEQKAISKLKKGKITLTELSKDLGVDRVEARKILESLRSQNIPVDQRTRGRGTELYHINVLPEIGNVFHISNDTERTQVYKLAATSDWHMASVFHLPKSLRESLNEVEGNGIKDVFIAGDLMDGIGIYKGHLENVTTPSIEGQTDLVAKVMSDYPKLRFWGIAGNHDYSFTQQNGAKPLAILEAKVDNFKNLGDMRADVIINGIRIRLLHGAGGRNYARSYPSQTYLRDYFGGLERHQLQEIPHVMIIGHYHTYYQGFDHGIHILQSGSFQDGDNEYCVRRGLTGPAGLFHVEIKHRSGDILDWKTTYTKPEASKKEKGRAFKDTTRSYT